MTKVHACSHCKHNLTKIEILIDSSNNSWDSKNKWNSTAFKNFKEIEDTKPIKESGLLVLDNITYLILKADEDIVVYREVSV